MYLERKNRIQAKLQAEEIAYKNSSDKDKILIGLKNAIRKLLSKQEILLQNKKDLKLEKYEKRINDLDSEILRLNSEIKKALGNTGK